MKKTYATCKNCGTKIVKLPEGWLHTNGYGRLCYLEVVAEPGNQQWRDE